MSRTNQTASQVQTEGPSSSAVGRKGLTPQDQGTILITHPCQPSGPPQPQCLQPVERRAHESHSVAQVPAGPRSPAPAAHLPMLLSPGGLHNRRHTGGSSRVLPCARNTPPLWTFSRHSPVPACARPRRGTRAGNAAGKSTGAPGLPPLSVKGLRDLGKAAHLHGSRCLHRDHLALGASDIRVCPSAHGKEPSAQHAAAKPPCCQLKHHVRRTAGCPTQAISTHKKAEKPGVTCCLMTHAPPLEKALETTTARVRFPGGWQRSGSPLLSEPLPHVHLRQWAACSLPPPLLPSPLL